MIELSNLTFSFDQAESPTLNRLNLSYRAGELGLVCGPTGSGKSTLLKAINGLAPHFTAGAASGSIHIHGQEFLGKPPFEFSRLVGYVSQQAENSFVADLVAEEIAFGMEQLGISPDEMSRRIAQVAKQLDIEHLLEQNVTTLSGGQQQRVAIAAALAAGQKVLLLDEPTSELDAASGHELLLLLRKLADQENLCVLIAEHRIERALGLVDSVTVVHGDGTASKAEKNDMHALLNDYRMVPPAVELGQALDWKPLPLTIESAAKHWSRMPKHPLVNNKATTPEKVLLEASLVSVRYSNLKAVDQVSLQLFESEILGLMGPNGSGKSSLLWALQGTQPFDGAVNLTTSGKSPAALPQAERLAHITLVPQAAADLLMFNSISEELADSDRVAKQPNATTAAIFADLAGRIDPKRHPRDLSAGQQLALVLAIQLAKGAQIFLLDEPTRGLDYQSKKQLAAQLKALKKQNHAILLSSHDVEFLSLVSDRVIRLESGQIAAQGSPKEILGELGELAPQIWQVTQSALTVSQALDQVKHEA